MSFGTDRNTAQGLDEFLLQVVRERRLVAAAHLEEARAEQAREREQGVEPPRPLGAILVARGWLSDIQFLSLVEEYGNREPLSPPPAPRPSHRLGQILVEAGLVAQEKIDEALRLQALDRARKSGPIRRIGEILVEKGYASPDAIAYALGHQQKSILHCEACGSRSNVTGYDPARTYACPNCKGPLRPLEAFDAVRVGETTIVSPGVMAGLRLSKTRPQSPFGKYVVLRQVGKGGMAVVYEALDPSVNRKVALKLMLAKEYSDPEAARMEEERFLREAKLAGTLPKHPNLVSVYEAGVIDGRRYITMEFIEGIAMCDWWRKEGLPLRRQVELLRDVARAAHFAHRHGVIHRDLKPENVLVDKEERPHITDFGLAKTIGHAPGTLTMAGMVVGTPGYMSPEQATGHRDADHRMDIYALGVQIFEILTDRRPFEGENAMEILMKATRNPVPSPLAMLKAGLDPAACVGLSRICLKAMARDPRQRYPDAAALAADLERWLKGESVEAALPGGRRRRIALLAALALALAALAVFLSGREDLPPPPGPQPQAGPKDPGFEILPERFSAVGNQMLFKEPGKMFVCQTGSIEAPFSVPAEGPYEISVRASSLPVLDEFAKFNLRVDSMVIGGMATTAQDPAEYRFVARLAAGDHALRIDFLNDYYQEAPKLDRNLVVHAVRVRRR